MKNIYIILTDTGSKISKLLKLFSGAEYNHISLCLEDNLDTFYSFGRRKIWFPLIGGFVTERMNHGIYQIFKRTKCLIYKLPVAEYKYLKLEQNLQEFINNSKYYKYNFAGLIGILINKPLKMGKRYTCSHFVAYILEKSDILTFDKNVMLVTPMDFCGIIGLEKVYEGMMADFILDDNKSESEDKVTA